MLPPNANTFIIAPGRRVGPATAFKSGQASPNLPSPEEPVVEKNWLAAGRPRTRGRKSRDLASPNYRRESFGGLWPRDRCCSPFGGGTRRRFRSGTAFGPGLIARPYRRPRLPRLVCAAEPAE